MQKYKNIIKKNKKAMYLMSKNINNYSFDSFNINKKNQMAYRASITISSKAGVLYNPLYIYGSIGTEKTHLLYAIKNEAEKQSQLVLYITLKKRKKYKQYEFIKYNYVLIDDLQEIKNTKDIFNFLNMIKNLIKENKQVVFTTNCLPSKVPFLNDFLRNNFKYALISDIGL